MSESPDLYSRLSVPGAAVTQHRRWASVDALRALAALMVLASHAPWLGQSQHAGLAKELPRLGVGVWIFFAASGYLIAGPFLRALLDGRPLPPVRKYALRRAVRIFPAYWVALTAILVLATGASIAHWWQLPVHVLLVQGLVPNELKNLYLVAWSLGVEVIFYVLVPAGAWAVRRALGDRPVTAGQLARIVVGVWAVCFAVTAVLAVAYPLHAGRPVPGGVQVLNLIGYLGNFCPGMLVFLALAGGEGETSRWRQAYRVVSSRPLVALIAAAAVFVVATDLPFQTNALAGAEQGPLFGVAAGLVLAAFLHGSWTRPISRVLAPIGLASYGVYLWHFAILSALLHHGVTIGPGTGNLAVAVRVVVLIALTVPVAMLSWLVIERPLLRRTTGWEKRAGAPAVPPAVAPEPVAPAEPAVAPVAVG